MEDTNNSNMHTVGSANDFLDMIVDKAAEIKEKGTDADVLVFIAGPDVFLPVRGLTIAETTVIKDDEETPSTLRIMVFSTMAHEQMHLAPLATRLKKEIFGSVIIGPAVGSAQ